MRRFPFALITIVAAALVAGCSNNAAAPPAGAPASSLGSTHIVDSGIAQPRSLRLFRTPPHPPPRRHAITGAMRRRARAGGWQQISSIPAFPNGPQTELLMTDGSVLVFDYCATNVYKLTPDQTGSYVTGTWKQLASLPSGYAPLYFASAVLPDGKLIINGGEYNFCNGAETTLGAIYDPVADTWTPVTGPSGWSRVGDAQSIVLNNGTYMIGNCCTSVQAQLNESTMTWTQVGTGKGDTNSEEGWTLMPGGNILTADVGNAPDSEIFNAKSSTWSAAAPVPVNLTSGFEIGPQTLRANGTIWVAGASGLSAVYNIKKGTWTQGPSFPGQGSQQLDVADGPSTLLTNGTIMVAASPGLYNAPTTMFIYNGKKLKSIPAFPQAPNDSSYNVRLLLLPTGQILEDDGSTDMEVYTPSNLGSPGYAPQISSVPTTLTHGNTYKIMGRRFNGMSQTNMYGDDVQQATNYPLVRVTNGTTGHVFYCKTHNHSFMGVGSSRKVSTMFDVPSTIETGASSLVVVTNGVASAPVSVTIQ